MVVCKECKGNCDNGELVGGICPECLEKLERRKQNAGKAAKLINSSFYQAEMNLSLSGSQIRTGTSQ